ncbi:MAG TPA: hypothetical protein VGZ02_08925 [Candidatus Baltobacteraceae bacterium]|jgi:hypothetical protein|nr:hypothetical protein [Candidatus Baltobacteraceae bacterium]
MLPADDYAKAVSALQNPARPAYVSFVTAASARGLRGDSDPAHTVFVRTKDGAIVEGSLENFSTGHYERGDDTNPVSRPAFDPACYAPADEETTQWEGRQALRIALRATCSNKDPDGSDNGDAPFDALYVDPATLAPLGATGTMGEEGVSVDLEEHFARFGPYVFASDLSANVHGHGWLFWVRERATVTYSDYKFYERLPIIRRQAASGSR